MAESRLITISKAELDPNPCMFAMLKNDHEKVLALQSDNQILLSKIDALSAEVEQLKELINNISRKE